MITRRLFLPTLSMVAVFLTGCGFNSSSTPVPVAGGTSAHMSGKVYGGQQPVLGSTVSVVAVGTGGYGSASTVLASILSSPIDGSFQFPAGAYTCPSANTPIYLLAQGGDAGAGINTSLALAVGIGSCSGAPSVEVNINEVTTVATAYAMAQFFTKTLGATDDFGANQPTTGNSSQGLVYSNTYTIPTLVNISYGTANPSTASITIESAKLNSIADILAACVNSSGTTGEADPCGVLFTNTTPPGATQAPTDTLQAAVQMALYPYQNVSTLFNKLITPTAPFVGLSIAPNDLTLGVSYTTSTMGLGVSGIAQQSGTSSNIDIDSEGRVWFPSNLSTAVGVGNFDPTSTTFNGPYNTDGFLIQPQYVAIDLNGYVWATDQASGFAIGFQQDDPTDIVGWVYTADDGNPINGGPIAIDQDNSTFWELQTDASGPVLAYGSADYSTTTIAINFTNTPTGLTTNYDGQSTANYFLFGIANGLSTTCDVEFAYDDEGNYVNDVVVENETAPCVSGGSASVAEDFDIISSDTTDNQLCSVGDGCFAPGVPLNSPQGIATDGIGSIWVANAGDGSVSTLFGIDLSGEGNDYAESSPVEYNHNGFGNGGTMSVPYGLAIDGSGNVWVSNASCLTTSTTACTPGAFVLSELIGAAAPTITPIAAQASGTAAGSEPELKRAHQANRVSPLLSKIPEHKQVEHLDSKMKGIAVRN